MSNVIQLIAYKASRENVEQLDEVAAHFAGVAKRPITKSEALRTLVSDAHKRIFKGETGQA
jgi:hypothetical protein